MKTDRTALFWGTVVALAIIAASLVRAFEFPHIHLTFNDRQMGMFLATAALFALVIASYRKLWRSPGFWALFLMFLGAHVILYSLFVVKIADEIRGVQMDFLYGVMGGAEFLVFALIVLRLYHRGPDTRCFTGSKVT